MSYPQDASGVSTQFIDSMIQSQRHHIGNIRGNAFFPVTTAPDDEYRQDAAHQFVIFERHRVFVPKNLVDDVQGHLQESFGRPGVDLLTADPGVLKEGRWDRLAVPHEKLGNKSTLELLDALGWHLLDLTGIEQTAKPEGVVWDLVRKFWQSDATSVEPVKAIPLSPFDDCVAYGRPYPTTHRPAHRKGGGHATVLILDSGLLPHEFLVLPIVDEVDAPIDNDDAYLGNTTTLRQGAGHGTFIAGIIHQHANEAQVLVADVTDGAANPNGYVVDEVQLFHSLCQGLAQTKTTDLIVNLSIATWAVPFNSANDPFAQLIALTKSYTVGQVAPIDLDNVPTGKNIVYIAAAGNHGGASAADMFPANLPDVYAIGALNPTGNTLALFSVSQKLDAVAIGEDAVGPYLEGTVPGNAQVPGQVVFGPNPWAMWSGTSFAAPRVCAAIARRVSSSISAQAAWDGLVVATAPRVNNVPVIT